MVWNWLLERRAGVCDAYLAEDTAGKVIGHYGLARLPYVADGREGVAGLLCKLAIDGQYRRTPLFMRLTMRVGHQRR